MWIFLAAITVVALLGADSDLRPSFGGKPLSMALVIQMFMLLTGGVIIILTKTNPASISKNEVFRLGMILHCGGVRYCMDGGNHVRCAYVRNPKPTGRNGERRVSEGLCHCSSADLRVGSLEAAACHGLRLPL